MTATPAIEVRDLWYWYEDHIPALQGVSLTIEPGDFVAIIGQNGSGKTTLAKHFNGLLRPSRGKVLIEGQDTGGKRIGELARRVGFVFQNPDHQIFASSTRDEITFGLNNLGLSAEEVGRRTDEALQVFGLEPYADAPPAVLGYGIRRKITVAAVYAMCPPIIVLDEPTTGLDWRSIGELMNHIAGLHRAGHTIVLISHDMKVVTEWACKTLVLADGQVLMYDVTREVFRQETLLARSFIQPPQITRLSRGLRDHGMGGDSLTVAEFYREFQGLLRRR